MSRRRRPRGGQRARATPSAPASSTTSRTSRALPRSASVRARKHRSAPPPPDPPRPNRTIRRAPRDARAARRADPAASREAATTPARGVATGPRASPRSLTGPPPPPPRPPRHPRYRSSPPPPPPPFPPRHPLRTSQLESEFNVNLTEPESTFARNMSKLEKELQLMTSWASRLGASDRRGTRRDARAAAGAAPPPGARPRRASARRRHGCRGARATRTSAPPPRARPWSGPRLGQDDQRRRGFRAPASAGKPSGGGIARTLSAARTRRRARTAARTRRRARRPRRFERRCGTGGPPRRRQGPSAAAAGRRTGGCPSRRRRRRRRRGARAAHEPRLPPRRGRGRRRRGVRGEAVQLQEVQVPEAVRECFVAGVFCNVQLPNCQNTPTTPTSWRQSGSRRGAEPERVRGRSPRTRTARTRDTKGCHCRSPPASRSTASALPACCARSTASARGARTRRGTARLRQARRLRAKPRPRRRPKAANGPRRRGAWRRPPRRRGGRGGGDVLRCRRRACRG